MPPLLPSNRYLGACGGVPACSTCHLIYSKDLFDRIPNPPTEDELDLLDMAPGLTETYVAYLDKENGLSIAQNYPILDAEFCAFSFHQYSLHHFRIN